MSSRKLSLVNPSGFKVSYLQRLPRAGQSVPYYRAGAGYAGDRRLLRGCRDGDHHAGPFAAGTEISAEVIAPLLSNPPALRVEGSYPEWTIKYEDGDDDDFNDLIMTVTATPVTP